MTFGENLSSIFIIYECERMSLKSAGQCQTTMCEPTIIANNSTALNTLTMKILPRPTYLSSCPARTRALHLY